MIEPDPPEPAPRRTFRLWHLTAAVLVSALVFGAIRALGDNSTQSWVVLVIAVVLGTAYVGSISIAAKLGGRATWKLKQWGFQQGGVIGFLAWLIGLLAQVTILLATIFLGPTLVVVLCAWIIRLIGP